MSLVLHAFVISFPEDQQIFDERLFSWASRTLLDGEDRTPYQMPGIYIIGAAVISVFGDNWFSHRVPIVIFGMLTLLVFYSICTKFTSKQNALLASTILSFDTVFFLHSQLFLRDVPMMFFGMLSFWFYLNKRYYLSALCLGFGAFIKETILFFMFFIIIYHFTVNFQKIKNDFMLNLRSLKHLKLKTSHFTPVIFLAIVCSSFLLPLWMYDSIVTPIVYDPVMPKIEFDDGTENVLEYPQVLLYESRGKVVQRQVGEITNPIEHLDLYFSSGILSSYDPSKRTVTYNYIPYHWILPLLPDFSSTKGGIVMGIIQSESYDNTQGGWPHKGETLGVERVAYQNTSLWPIGFWGSLIFGCYSIIRSVNKRPALFILSGISTMFLPYLFMYFFNIRVVFPYYFIITVPIISIGIILLFDQIKNHNIRFITKLGLLSAVVAWFVWYFPVKILG